MGLPDYGTRVEKDQAKDRSPMGCVQDEVEAKVPEESLLGLVGSRLGLPISRKIY